MFRPLDFDRCFEGQDQCSKGIPWNGIGHSNYSARALMPFYLLSSTLCCTLEKAQLKEFIFQIHNNMFLKPEI